MNNAAEARFSATGEMHLANASAQTTAIAVVAINANEAPMKTAILALEPAASPRAANWVLSPSSATKIVTNAVSSARQSMAHS